MVSINAEAFVLYETNLYQQTATSPVEHIQAEDKYNWHQSQYPNQELLFRVQIDQYIDD